MKNLIPLIIFSVLLVACSKKHDSAAPEDLSSKACTEKKLMAFAETKVGFQEALARGTQRHEDHALSLCARYKPLFAKDCTLDCSDAKGTMSGILCANDSNNGKVITLTDMKDTCEYFEQL